MNKFITLFIFVLSLLFINYTENNEIKASVLQNIGAALDALSEDASTEEITEEAKNAVQSRPFLQNQNATDTSSEIHKEVLNKWFSKDEDTNKYLINPMISNAPLYTLDQERSNNVQFFCAGSSSAIEITIEPSSTKDLQEISIKYDKNLDGTLESTLTINGPISGICANGFIKCSAGTWVGCQWFLWDASVQIVNNSYEYNLSYRQTTSFQDLKQCFCINTSCVKPEISFDTYKDEILKTIGAGIVSALVNVVNPRFRIAQGQIENYTIKYTVQDVTNCQTVNIQENNSFYPSVVNPESLFSQPDQILAESEQILQQQITTEDSLTNLVFDVNELNANPQVGEIRRYQCIIERDYSPIRIIEEKTKVVSCWQNQDAQNNYRISIKVRGATENPDLDDKVEYEICVGSCNSYSYIRRSFIPAFNTCEAFNLGSVYYEYDNDRETVSLSAKVCYSSLSSKIDIHLSCVSSKGRRVGEFLDLRIDGGESLTNECASFEAESTNCRLVEEKTYDAEGNWVYTYYNYRELEHELEETCRYGRCFPWWKKERIYECQAEQNSSQNQTNLQNEIDNMTQTIESIESIVQNFQLDFQEENCIKVCQIAKPVYMSQAKEAATEAHLRRDTRYIITLKKCNENNECPVEPNESIIKNCHCSQELNRLEFQKVTAVMEIIGYASEDQICSIVPLE